MTVRNNTMHTITHSNRYLKRIIAMLAMAALVTTLLQIQQGSRADAVATGTTLVCDAPNGVGSGDGTDGSPLIYDLTARGVWIQAPDGASIYMWSYVPTDKNTGNYRGQFPGPNLCVRARDHVQVNLINELEYQNTDTSIVFPGQTGVTASGGNPGVLTREAAPYTDGDDAIETATYEFVANEPGTYLYESGTDPVRQVAMGLFGGLVVRPFDAGPDYVYEDAATGFDSGYEYLLIFHEIDPALHNLVQTGQPIGSWDPVARHERYWTINGRSFPDVIAPNGARWLPTQPYGGLVHMEAMTKGVVRYANAGLDNHPFHPHGDTLHIIGQDGRSNNDACGADPGDATCADLLQQGTVESFSKTVSSGATFELIADWHDVEPWNIDPDNNPVPVTVPGLENMIFKDGATFSSGVAEFGETGLLPPGTTTYNECGEYYFPWHSHALNETQNYDQGFGGMFTLWRIDPPGGCGGL
jgi:Multicopper oxidase